MSRSGSASASIQGRGEANTLHWRAEVEQLALGAADLPGASRNGAFHQARLGGPRRFPGAARPGPPKLLALTSSTTVHPMCGGHQGDKDQATLFSGLEAIGGAKSGFS